MNQVRRRTDEGDEDEDDVESQSGAGGGEEDADRADGDDDGADDDGDEQLDGNDGVDFPDEGPAQFGALQHHRIQRPCAALQISFPVWLVPHLLSCGDYETERKCREICLGLFGSCVRGMKWDQCVSFSGSYQ